jgi:hypothetical protein
MSFHRSVFVALATVFAVGMAPSAFAQCCGYQAPAQTYYAPAPVAQGCGTCGVQAYAPIVYATPVAPAPINVGCGVCGTPTAAVTFVPPVAPMPAPVAWNPCNTCGVPAPVMNPCNTCGVAATPVYTQPAPLYVVNQGPDYTGPGIVVPYRTYAPQAEYAPPPYYPGYPHRYYPRPYYHHAYYAPRYYGHPYYRHYYTHHYWRG